MKNGWISGPRVCASVVEVRNWIGTENEHFTDHEKRRFSPIKTQQNSRFSSVFPMNHDSFHKSSARSAKNKTGRFQHRDVEFENPLDSAKNKTGRFQQRNASAQSAKNKTGRFQHRDAQFENPLCHDPLLYVVRFEVCLYYMFLKITQVKDVLTLRILWKSHLYREETLT